MMANVSNKRRGQIISMLLVFVILFCTACGKNADSTGNTSNSEINGSDINSGKNESQNDNQAVGRYVENEKSGLKDFIDFPADIKTMEDGSLAVFDTYAGMWSSADNGETWEYNELEWFSTLMEEEAYILHLGMTPDGYFILSKGIFDSSDSGEENNDFNTECLLVKPDGSLIKCDIKLDGSTYIMNTFATDDGRMFASALNGSLYEINREDGSAEKLFETEDYIYQLDVQGNHLVCASAEGIGIYDLTTNEKVEDKVLDDFVKTNLGQNMGQTSERAIPVKTLLEDENIMYIICEKGIYRHVIGGTSMEQVLDGSLSSLSNPSFYIITATLVEDSSFYVLFCKKLDALYL